MPVVRAWVEALLAVARGEHALAAVAALKTLGDALGLLRSVQAGGGRNVSVQVSLPALIEQSYALSASARVEVRDGGR